MDHTQFEIFILDPAGDGTEEAEATALGQQTEETPVGEASQAVVDEPPGPAAAS